MKISRLLDTKKISETPPGQNAAQENVRLDEKIQELIEVIGQSAIAPEHSAAYEAQIAEAFKESAFRAKQVAPFQALDRENNLSREELLEGLEKLLAENQIDSRNSSSHVVKNTFQKAVNFIIAILLIVFGFAMIIMPAPPSFEMFTVFYFNPNDGVTIMDLVSLLIIFGGVLLFVLNFNKK
ncbi:hypothetical protein [Dyadobacter sp. CY326]|uniref:hypothetical protein n=1 Tax=Dyadobacter sp. CY326 TaxID=2907300 RepID=UPI001F1CE119|nr:hypothetical protein [Dyadobacter sp. CY326]MCE7066062.1 hypothetical protein [Dyadobacter sp. CY326]